ncbi:helix-turn-helix domain-containing protein [Aurantimonas sp. VKM B-3413]|uniref:helix-turn-helix domain-containing protein n=1 Tax=Aurantimonas sp. VKM B-3413 TaxID=2779401 RepID=UPI00351CDAB5
MAPGSLRELRIGLGFTIDAVSTATGLTARRLWSIEEGAAPSPEEMEWLDLVYGTAKP